MKAVKPKQRLDEPMEIEPGDGVLVFKPGGFMTIMPDEVRAGETSIPPHLVMMLTFVALMVEDPEYCRELAEQYFEEMTLQ